MPIANLNSLLDELVALDDRDTRAEILIEYAEKFKAVPDSIAVRPYAESRRVPGCESEVFVFSTPGTPSGKLYFAVENPHGISAKALAVILDEGLSGESRQAIESVTEDAVTAIFGSGLSMGKGQGLMNMLRAAKLELCQHFDLGK